MKLYRIDVLVQRSWAKVPKEEYDDLVATIARAQELANETKYAHVVVQNKNNRHLKRIDVEKIAVMPAYIPDEPMSLSEKLAASRKAEETQDKNRRELYNQRKRHLTQKGVYKSPYEKKRVFSLTCAHCTHAWRSTIPVPARCPRCRSYAWQDASRTGKERAEHILEHRCLKCGHEWRSSRIRPNMCPNRQCASEHWDRTEGDVFVDNKSGSCENADSGVKTTVDPAT